MLPLPLEVLVPAATTHVIPCKKPKVVVEPHPNDPTMARVSCRVPGCGWSYPSESQHRAVKTDASAWAVRHRTAHRSAVPGTEVSSEGGPGFGASCACGWEWAHRGTRTDATMARDHHLCTDHGLVTCM